MPMSTPSWVCPEDVTQARYSPRLGPSLYLAQFLNIGTGTERENTTRGCISNMYKPIVAFSKDWGGWKPITVSLKQLRHHSE